MNSTIKKKSVITNLLIHGLILIASVVGIAQICLAKDLGSYLHKDAILAVPPLSSPPPADLIQKSDRMPISPQKACWYAIGHLEAKGIKDILICEVQWIAAPVSGYLVDTKGKLTMDGNCYMIFRIGITDGFHKDVKKYPAGEAFVFIAFGEDTHGKPLWYPGPGPDYEPAEGEVITESLLTYEFLLNRERFETLGKRYP